MANTALHGLLDSIWQGLMLFLLLWIFLRLTREWLQPNIRYWVSVLVLFAIPAMIIGGMIQASGSDPTPSYGPFSLLIIQAAKVVSSDTWGYRELQGFISSFINQNTTLLLGLWVLGVTGFGLRFLGGIWMLHKLRSRMTPVENEIKIIAHRIYDLLQIRHDVRIAQSPQISTPFVIGFFKPVILIPASILAGIDPKVLEIIITHELAHIRRKDPWVNLVQTWTETLLFFNPFVWMISDIIRRERELACDQMVLKTGVDKKGYAEVLSATASQEEAAINLQLALAGNRGSHLLVRIKKIFSNMEARNNGNLPAVLFTLLLMAICYLTITNGFSIKDRIYHVSEANVYDDFAINELQKVRISSMGWLPDVLTLSEELRYKTPYSPFLQDTLPDENLEEAMERMGKMLEESMKNIHDLTLRMEEMTEAFNHERLENLEDVMRERFDDKEWEDWAEDLKSKLESDLEYLDFGFLKLLDTEWNSALENHMGELEEQIRVLMEEDYWKDELKSLNKVLRTERKHLEAFEEELKQNLIEDGYLNKGEELNIHFGEDQIKINGEKIREKDERKYREIRKKYFPKDRGNFRYK